MRNVLLTGAGAPGGPGIIKALKTAGYSLHTSDCDATASGRFLHSTFIQIPKAEDEIFIPFVLNYCITNGIDVVFPLVTKELFKFSEAKNLFAAHGVKLIVSNTEALDIANDKGLLYQHLSARGIPVPEFAVVNDVAALEKTVRGFDYPKKAVVVKPCLSNGSRGVRILQENIDEHSLLFEHKPTHLYLTLSHFIQILKQKPFPPLLVSEYLPGQEVTVDTLLQDGIPKLVLPRTREKMRAGISVQGTFINHQPIIQYCKDVLQTLDVSGPIGLQVKENVNGEYRLLEINPRIQGTSVAALGLGINLPALAVEQAFGPVEIDTSSIAWGTSFVRFYEEAFYK